MLLEEPSVEMADTHFAIPQGDVKLRNRAKRQMLESEDSSGCVTKQALLGEPKLTELDLRAREHGFASHVDMMERCAAMQAAYSAQQMARKEEAAALGLIKLYKDGGPVRGYEVVGSVLLPA